MNERFSLDSRAHSEIGLVRNNNQDSAYVSSTMLLVADGMGGAAAGDLASSVAVSQLRQVDEKLRAAAQFPSASALVDEAAAALRAANDKLAELVVADHSLEGMGTTVCGGLFDGNQLALCHIGDSRGYLLRDGEMTQLTHDHSWVQSLVDEGKIRPEEAEHHPHRSLLLKVLNGQPTHSPDFQIVGLQAGDRLLFCSDGLSGLVSNEHIAQLMKRPSLDDALARLIVAAHQGGGLDNISIVLADVVSQDDALDAKTPEVLGAAADVNIPTISPNQGIDLSGVTRVDRTGATNAASTTPSAPAPKIGGEVGSEVEPPAGLIDPDRFEPDQYEQARYSPQLPTKRRRWIPITIISVLLVAGLIVGGIFGAKAYLSGQYFIGPQTTSSGTSVVAVYRGVPGTLLGRDLNELVEQTEAELKYLPSYFRSNVENGSMRYDSLEQAQQQAQELTAKAALCKQMLSDPNNSATAGECT